MAETWLPGKNNDDPKINPAAATIRATLTAMCGMHIHTLDGKRRHDIEIICEQKYHELVKSLENKYPEAVAMKQVAYTTAKKLKKMTGTAIYRLSQRVRKMCVNSYNIHWQACLQDGQPSSGRSWHWVKMRVLVALFWEQNKNTEPLPSNQGMLYHFATSQFIILSLFLCYFCEQISRRSTNAFCCRNRSGAQHTHGSLTLSWLSVMDENAWMPPLSQAFGQ